MKITSLKIGKQLVIAFAIMLALVVTLGITSYFQSQRLHDQTSTMFLHPFQVQNAIGDLRADILSIHRDLKDLLISDGHEDMSFSLIRISGWENDANKQIQILHNQYLGPIADVDSVEYAMIAWKSMRATTIQFLQAGSFQEAAKRTERSGTAGKQVEVILKAIDKVDAFATKKAENLFQSSIALNDALNKQLLLLVTLILVITVLINFTLLRNIRTPLIELTDTTRRFHNGDLTARNSYKSGNEFGVLSATFNTLAASIEESLELNERTSSLSRLMISESDEKEFFYTTLAGLAMHTNSQMAAIYLLCDEKKNFCHFESIGLDESARQKFSATNFEGEFGTVLSTRKIQHIKNLPEDTRFIFQAVSGKFIAHEILSIPVIAGNEIIGIISLASVNKYSKQIIRLIENIHDLLNARIEGVLAYSRINAFSSKMELQNHELEAQKAELYSQSTELLGQNTELEMQKAQLNEANRLKTNFLSNMSHELRTPLNSVIALSGVLSRRLVSQIPDEEYSYLEVIERNGKNLLVLINDILDISRIEAGREEIDIATFSIDSLVADVISMIIPQADEKNVGLIQTVNNSELVISSDPDKIRHILQNLIGNAVKFTDEGEVKVVVEKTDNGIVITVADTGIGIAEEHLAHIFDEFRQADGSTSRRFGGSGLGLAIAKKYANLLGGSISVESSIGEGSRFMLTLPLRYAFENKISDEVKPSEFKNKFYQAAKITEPNVAKKTILLVEDSEPAIIQMKDILNECGYTILSAHNGSEALQIISNVIPDAIILDLMMPGMDGFEVLKTLREADRTAGIPVLILTAKHITKEELSTLKRNNIHQLIQKGDVNRQELLNAVGSMIKAETTHISKPKRDLPAIDGKPLVLVVEDNPDNMITVKALLSDNFEVLEAVDGNEGFAMARKHRPDFILMDIALPEMDGIAAFRAIRNEAKLQHIPVIALTASAMTSDREIILAHGFDAYIAKPIDDKLFFKTINNVLYGI